MAGEIEGYGNKMVEREDIMKVPTRSRSPPHLFSFFYPPVLPSCPFFTHLPSLPLLLTPSLARLLMRAGGTIVPLLLVFGNPGLKQSLFTQAVAQPGPSASLRPGQDHIHYRRSTRERKKCKK
ncbi:unnamed protein product [Pleuronectes platessa]|uniref:Uncharacterized protein n=1 Tax=Pleuronectes platessa TaxID=8262 RepID=A0A9N7VMB7_PLEPL|nr:unnamed protein product [Pleuronectes platessa]